MTVGSLFAGVGGIELGFELAGARILWANEINKDAALTYKANFKHKLIISDIKNLKAKELLPVDILTGGFPCQSFSVAGYRKGFEDPRGNVFFEIARLLEEFKTISSLPRVVFLENVKNLERHDKGKTFTIIKETLEKIGYYVDYKVLNATEYANIPQNRERIFIIAFFNKDEFARFEWPKPTKLKTKLANVIDFSNKVAEKYYYSDRYKCFDLIKESVIEHDKAYQYRRVYVRENKSKVSPTLTANMGTGGHNVPLIYTYDKRVRKLTPRECFLLQGYSKSFLLPETLTDSKLYQQAGNSVVVPLIERLAKNILKAIDSNQD